MPDIVPLNVLLHGQSIGTLLYLSGDRTQFVFNEDYIKNQERSTLSISFHDAYGELITDIRPTQTRLAPFFANLLPEGRMREYLAERADVNPQREFFLLWVLGRDLPGALEIRPADGQSWPLDSIGDTQIIDETEGEATTLRFSLAGVQLKFSAVQQAGGGLTIPAEGVGGSWIVKLPSTVHSGVPENEYAMMELARRVGIDAPETALVPVDEIVRLPKGIERAGKYAFAIKRFDRDASGAGVHIEDFAQVFGVYPDEKYKRISYRNIAEVIWNVTGEPGIAEFIRRFVFNALIGNADMHLKNWSLIYPDKRNAALAPAYDFVSTVAYIPDDKLALNFAGSKDFDALDMVKFERFAAKARLPKKLVLNTAQETLDNFAQVWRQAGDIQIDRRVQLAIAKHLKTIPLWKSR